MTQGADRAALERQVTERAASDQQFRRDLMSDPRGTVGREFGVAIPEGIDIAILEESPTAVYLVLPPAPEQAGDELSDAELEAVAGGWSDQRSQCGTCIGTCTCKPQAC